MTLKEAKTLLRSLGITLRKVDGEYQTKPRGARWDDDCVDYQTDLESAVGTGRAMAEWHRTHSTKDEH